MKAFNVSLIVTPPTPISVASNRPNNVNSDKFIKFSRVYEKPSVFFYGGFSHAKRPKKGVFYEDNF